jgi:hypothetical protein
LTRAIVVAALLAAAGCANFEDPEIVLDLRILGMQVDPPEVVAPVNPDDPAQIDITQLEDTTACALVADPNAARRLAWSLTACPPTDSGRCDQPDDPSTLIGEGSVDDPETADAPPMICGELLANGNLIAILMESFSADDLLGFGGISAQIELRVEPEGGGEPVFGTKRMRYSAQLPADRVANTVPSIVGITATFADETVVDMPAGRCRDVDPVAVGPGEEIKLEPVEPEGIREDYVLQAIDGDRVELTENITYHWHSTTGDWQRHTSGGPRDPFGNEPQLFSRWTAPSDPAVVGAGLDVELWIVYRDERGGVAWLQSCAAVVP